MLAKMNTLLIATCLLVGSSFVHCAEDVRTAAPYLTYFEDVYQECAAAHPIEGATDILKFYMSSISPKKTHEHGCMKACLLEKKEMMKDGKIVMDGVYQLVDKITMDKSELNEQLKAISKSCYEETKNEQDKCELADKMTVCYMSKHPKMQ